MEEAALEENHNLYSQNLSTLEAPMKDWLCLDWYSQNKKCHEPQNILPLLSNLTSGRRKLWNRTQVVSCFACMEGHRSTWGSFSLLADMPGNGLHTLAHPLPALVGSLCCALLDSLTMWRQHWPTLGPANSPRVKWADALIVLPVLKCYLKQLP